VRDVARILHDAVDGRLSENDAVTLEAIAVLLPGGTWTGRGGALTRR
jgi:hypothetical protein